MRRFDGLDPAILEARAFVKGSESFSIRSIGRGTSALSAG
jgi:hypothetical protein